MQKRIIFVLDHNMNCYKNQDKLAGPKWAYANRHSQTGEVWNIFLTFILFELVGMFQVMGRTAGKFKMFLIILVIPCTFTLN